MIGAALMVTLAAAMAADRQIEPNHEEREAQQFLRLYMQKINDAERVDLDQKLEQGMSLLDWYTSSEIEEWKRQYGFRIWDWYKENGGWGRRTKPFAMIFVDHVFGMREFLLPAGQSVVLYNLYIEEGFSTHVTAMLLFAPGKNTAGYRLTIPAWKLSPLEDREAALLLRQRQMK